jgi:hypothetical protein
MVRILCARKLSINGRWAFPRQAARKGCRERSRKEADVIGKRRDEKVSDLAPVRLDGLPRSRPIVAESEAAPMSVFNVLAEYDFEADDIAVLF